jgi:DNA polymerase elongation subunit (family B)
MTKEPSVKILLWDIENAPALGYFYDMFREGNIIEVVEPPFMLSVAYKWLGNSKVTCIALPDFPGYKRNLRDDCKLLEAVSKVLDSADIIVAHNGDKFDITMTNTRLVTHCLSPLQPKKTVDTLKIARGRFKFLSNRLDDLGNVLGVGRKLPHTGKKLWLACMNGDLEAWKLMRKYNIQDVLLLEKVYLKLRPFATNHPNINHFTRHPTACPKCGSTHSQRRGHIYTATTEAPKFQCMGCH